MKSIRLVITVIALLFVISCKPNSSTIRRVSRDHLEIDRLSYLVEKSDLIATLQIEKNSRAEISKTSGIPETSRNARISKKIKGKEKSSETIKVYSSTSILPDKAAGVFLLLEEGSYLVFLKEYKDGYQFLTDQSMIHLGHEKVQTIWNRTDEQVLELKPYSLDEIVSQIETQMLCQQGGEADPILHGNFSNEPLK